MAIDLPVSSSAPRAVLLEEYREYLVRERGLASESVRCYCNHARDFLGVLPQPVEESVAGLDAGRVTAYVVEYCGGGRNTSSAKAMVTALRSLLRYLHVTGRTRDALVGAVPAVAGWRLGALPRGLAPEQVEALIAGCGPGTAVGVRDRAILIALSGLGLRTIEVARLLLGDVDWRAGQILIRGKGSRVERLPLPVPVGEALVEYLTDSRPATGCRSLFVTARGRPRALTADAVRQIVARACARAGLPRLRHTLATRMLRAGAPLAQVGQVLRHRSQLSTAVYAKVDFDALRGLAAPWPVDPS